jgi:hypothetical protein
VSAEFVIDRSKPKHLDREFLFVKFSENENTIPVDAELPAALVQAASSPQDHSSAEDTPPSNVTERQEFWTEELRDNQLANGLWRPNRQRNGQHRFRRFAISGRLPRARPSCHCLWRPPNATLAIKPEAGRIKDVQLWHMRVQEIGVRLRQDFELIYRLHRQ